MPRGQVCDQPCHEGGEKELELFPVSGYEEDLCISIHSPSSYAGISNLEMLHIYRNRTYRQTQHMDTMEYLDHNNAYRKPS